MADITAKRGPRDPSEGLSNQGVATQAMLNSMAREQQYELNKRLNKKSTWDKIMGGVKDVVNIGKGVMDIANSYEDLQVKDAQIKRSEVARQQQELNLEASKQQMGIQSLQNEMQLKDLTADNEFIDTINKYVKNNDFTGAATYALSNPKASNKYQATLYNLANQLEKNGDTDTADAFRMAASSGSKTQMANIMYGSKADPNRFKAANPEQFKNQLMYNSNVNALRAYLTSEDNGTKLAKLGIRSDQHLPEDLLSCVTRISTSNTVNDNNDRGEYLKSLKITSDESLGNLQSSSSKNGKNVQFVDITCPVNGVPHTEQFAFNANDKVRVQNYNEKGLPIGETTVPIGTAMSSLINRHDQYQSSLRESIDKTAERTQAEKYTQVLSTPQAEKVVDTPNIDTKVASNVQSTSSTSEDQIRQQEELRTKNYTDYKDGVYEELKNTGRARHLNNQAKGAIIENKVLEMSRDPDALNSFINGPVSQVMATMNPVEKEALQMYVQKMSIPIKQEIARVISTYIVQGGDDISKLINLIKPIIERSKVYQDTVSEVKETQQRRDYVGNTFRSHF